MSQIAIPALPKLPLGESISLSYAWFFRKFADVLRISWLWLVLSAILIGAGSWLQWTAMAHAFANAAKGTIRPAQLQMPSPLSVVLLLGLAYLVMMFGTTSIAVAWHRRTILGEQPGLSGGNIVTKPLWRYIGVGIAIALITFLPIAVILVPTALILGPATHGTSGNQPSGIAIALIVLIVFALYITALAIMLRLSVLLPARATGDLTLTFRQAWRRTRGNTWRMFWGLIACSVPPAIAMQIIFVVVMAAIGISKVLPTVPTDGAVTIPALGLAIMNMTFFVLYLLIVPLYIGFLSHSYRHFFQGSIVATE
jgi:hypothetical protein